MHDEEALDLLGRRRAVVERLVVRQHREVLRRGDRDERGDPRELLRLDLAVGLDREVRDAQAVVEQRELREDRQADAVATPRSARRSFASGLGAQRARAGCGRWSA